MMVAPGAGRAPSSELERLMKCAEAPLQILLTPNQARARRDLIHFDNSCSASGRNTEPPPPSGGIVSASRRSRILHT